MLLFARNMANKCATQDPSPSQLPADVLPLQKYDSTLELKG